MQLNDPNGQYNPYAPPTAGAAFNAPDGRYYGEQILAERLTRLGAILLDGLLMLLAVTPGIVVATLAFVSSAASRHARRPTFEPGDFAVAGLLAAVLMLPLYGYQWYLISKTGQTLGKRWTGIKIVKLDGLPVDFVSGVIMRNWIVGLMGAIPYVGSCVGLVDALMIFGDERRCLHDLIAGTKVIVAAGS